MDDHLIVKELFRRILIDVALKDHNEQAFQLLTSTGWEQHVISNRAETSVLSPYSGLCDQQGKVIRFYLPDEFVGTAIFIPTYEKNYPYIGRFLSALYGYFRWENKNICFRPLNASEFLDLAEECRVFSVEEFLDYVTNAERGASS